MLRLSLTPARAVAAALALSCVGCLAGALWLGTEERLPAKAGDARNVLAAFEDRQPADLTINLAARYGGRFELLDPKRTLPTWHKHVPREAIATYAALRACTEPSIDAFGARTALASDPELAKAIDWHAASCAHARPLMEALAERPPFMHPSGDSYARMLTRESPPPAPSWIAAHTRAFHVLELRELPTTVLTPDERALSALPAAAFARILEGDSTALTNTWIIHISRDQYGPTSIALRSRAAWSDFAERSGVSLGPIAGSAGCTEPESPVLCWRTQRVSGARRTGARVLGATGALLLAIGIVLLVSMVVRARRLAERERVFLLRALTHELRSPVTAMRLDVEPLRASLDALPEDCQEPLLRLSAGIERLSRVLTVTGRALSLFDGRGEDAASPIAARVIPSVNAYFEELREEWPEDVALDLPAEDRAFTTDPDWLRVAVRNLVENATKHGQGPVRVSARSSGDALVVRVSDHGKTPGLTLSDITRPFAKGERSEGLGLGLSLVRRIVERQGGRLRHEPDPTTFELRMPLGKNR